MWNWSTEAATLLTGSHTAISKVDILHGGKWAYTLEVIDGSVSVDADRPIRRNLTCTLIDSTGTLTTGDITDLLNPYECEIAPYRGVRTSVADEYAPQGIFVLTGRSVDDTPEGLIIKLTGQDRAMTYQGPMRNSLAIDGGTAVEKAIAKLLAERNSRLSLLAMATGFVTGPLLFKPDIDVWAEARKLAESVGARLYHDRTGQCVLSLPGPYSDKPVARYVEGEGLLLSLSRTEDSDTIRNVVVAESPDGLIRAVAEDTDPKSPTYAAGRYGRRVVAMTQYNYSSTTQALQAATARLAYELGRSETVEFTALVDPGRDVDEAVVVHRPRSGLKYRGVVVASLDMPLGVGDPMRVSCRQTRLAVDGRIFPADKLQ